MIPFDLTLYLVTDQTLTKNRSLEWIVEEAVKGGVTMVQMREKNGRIRDFIELAQRMKNILEPYKIPLIINDRLDVALASDAEGLHIGQSDIPHEIARKLLGYHKIIGLSVETFEQAREANDLDVDYIGISPVFSTNTKTDILKPFGLNGLKEISKFTRHKMVGIGGIHVENVVDVIAAGASGVAVVSAIMSAEDPKLAATKFIKSMNKFSRHGME